MNRTVVCDLTDRVRIKLPDGSAVGADTTLVADILLNLQKRSMTSIGLIAAERQRQIEQEGWSPEHDDAHCRGQLGMAAACYALPPNNHVRTLDWPWDRKWWRPTPDDRIRELVKAGALIAAEIDRLQRAEKPVEESSTGE